MHRTWAGAAVLLIGGVLMAGCGSSPSASPSTTTTHTVAYSGTALSWLSAKARPQNGILNDDQAAVNRASEATSETDATTYFARLAVACTRLRGDAVKAQRIPTAPSPALASAWHAMTVHTESYAADCLTLTRTHSNASLTRWNQSLKAMNTANASLNTVVAAVRSQAGESAG